MIEKGPVVYVVQEPRYKDAEGKLKTVNMLPALDFGSLELLLDRQVNILNAAVVTRELKQKLSNYRDQDFIVAAGDPVAIGIACAAAALANRGRFTVLKWDRIEGRYFAVPVDLMKAEV